MDVRSTCFIVNIKNEEKWKKFIELIDVDKKLHCYGVRKNKNFIKFIEPMEKSWVLNIYKSLDII